MGRGTREDREALRKEKAALQKERAALQKKKEAINAVLEKAEEHAERASRLDNATDASLAIYYELKAHRFHRMSLEEWVPKDFQPKWDD